MYVFFTKWYKNIYIYNIMLSYLLLASLYIFANSNLLPDVISEINVPSYLGHWKQVYQV